MTEETLDFRKETKKVHFRLKFSLLSAMHIGDSQGSVLNDKTIIREGNDPYVPGSSFKGVLRSASERVAEHFFQEHSPAVCHLEEGGCGQQNSERITEILEKHKDSDQQAFREIYQLLCPVCQTYGGGSILSKVKVSNGYFEGNLDISERNGNKIKRETGTTDPKKLFFYEVIDPGASFNIDIELENPSLEQELVLALGLAQFKESQVNIGGMQSKGLGSLELKEHNVKAIDFTKLDKKEKLAYYLKGQSSKVKELSLDEYLTQIFDRVKEEKV